MEKYFRRLVVAVLICAAGEYLAAAQTTVIDLSKNGADQIWQGTAGVANVGFWFDQGELGTGDKTVHKALCDCHSSVAVLPRKDSPLHLLFPFPFPLSPFPLPALQLN